MDKDLESKIKKIIMNLDDPRFEPVDGSKTKSKGKGAKFSVDSKGNVTKNFKGGGLAQAIEKVKAKEMKFGGEASKGKAVPPKFKGFSMLPESVQKNMDADLAEKFEFGGDVKGKKGKNVCRGRGIARPGTGFTIR